MTQVKKLVFLDSDAPCDDPIDALLNRLSGDDSKTQVGCRIHRNHETGAIAVFPSVPFYPVGSPEQRKLESEWEKRALAMHENQQPLPTLADKPSDGSTTGKYFSELRRGD